ncbi:hypothetical protein WICMUC_003130 [Wickerhamomyces mucosus]|uniref:Uncharacterized protein n=1 Tax=Wickerhamomyces mucosus TaxID=1378264 RepID=A0A9P8TDC5_9ASCO|nr:hypothetical protein WICMUC_003130 [Wickerhamomyces mucosus]
MIKSVNKKKSQGKIKSILGLPGLSLGIFTGVSKESFFKTIDGFEGLIWNRKSIFAAKYYYNLFPNQEIKNSTNNIDSYKIKDFKEDIIFEPNEDVLCLSLVESGFEFSKQFINQRHSNMRIYQLDFDENFNNITLEVYEDMKRFLKKLYRKENRIRKNKHYSKLRKTITKNMVLEIGANHLNINIFGLLTCYSLIFKIFKDYQIQIKTINDVKIIVDQSRDIAIQGK